MHTHEKRRERRQWETDHAAFTQQEQQRRHQYEQERAAALQVFLKSPEGRQHYEPAYKTVLELYKRREPHRASTAAHEATVARIEQDHFQFPDYSLWALTQHDRDNEASI
ncbi:MAG: hypothetical protein JWN70_4555 [Planctomycetaceae bacterium]|nr:hypothetical protein [Planctomycetaceae bacterium]